MPPCRSANTAFAIACSVIAALGILFVTMPEPAWARAGLRGQLSATAQLRDAGGQHAPVAGRSLASLTPASYYNYTILPTDTCTSIGLTVKAHCPTISLGLLAVYNNGKPCCYYPCKNTTPPSPAGTVLQYSCAS